MPQIDFHFIQPDSFYRSLGPHSKITNPAETKPLNQP